MRKLLVLMILSISLFIALANFSSAEIQTLGTFQQYKCIDLVQICGNCTYVNITSIKLPNSTVALSNVVMTKDRTNYNYTYCSPPLLGEYIVGGVGDDNGVNTVWTYNFFVTSTGLAMSSVWENPLLLILSTISLIFVVLGFWHGNPYFGFIGGAIFMLTGVYTVIYGLNDVANLYTRGIGWTFVGAGLFFSMAAAFEWVYRGDDDD